MELQKRDNETRLEHHKRLVYGKLDDKTLSDVDYTELSQFVYGKTYSSDVARRMMYGSQRTLEIVMDEIQSLIDDPDTLCNINSQLIELRKERQRFFDQRREFLKLVSKDGRKEHIYEQLTDAANNLANTVGKLFSDDFTTKHSDLTSDEAVLVLSDWHYGMVTDNVFNVYNTDICISRIKDIVSKAKQRIILHGCKKLHIIVLGDLYHGSIHTSARVASEELVCDQLMQVSEILAQAIFELGACVPETLLYFTYGNHARTIQSKHDSIHRDNMERLVPWWVEQRISAEENNCGKNFNIRVVPDAGNEFILANVNGHEFCASHGDQDSVKSSPRLLSTLFRKKLGRDIEYVLLGDKHHRESFDELGVTAMLCGSLCGTDDYANSKRLYSVPSQMLLIVNEDGVDAEYRLKCE